MNTSKQIWFISLLLLLSVSNSFSLPLNGTYTIGNNGRYLTISSAINDAMIQGISGPVIFSILPGIYNEGINIPSPAPGNSLINSITFKSQTGNSSDVLINGIIINSRNIFINELSIINYVFIGESQYVTFTNNIFNNNSITVRGWAPEHIYLIENVDINDMMFDGEEPPLGNYIHDVQIKNNKINGVISIIKSGGILIENNVIGNGIYISNSSGEKVLKNKVTGSVYCFGDFYNNFIVGNVSAHGKFINNTVIGGSLTYSTINILEGCLNNIFINPSGGNVMMGYYYSSSISDYNVFYNGGNSNLINYLGISYNNVQDFYNATGLDQHSNDQSVNFVSSTDLHLTGSSIGDPQLKCISNDLILDDIDGDLRSYTDPYKGADEVADTLLPVELSNFNSTINLNNVNLYWTTISEINNLGFVIERSVNKQNWLNAGFVQGHGSTTSINNYEFTDKGLNFGAYHYRLKQLDYNGNYEYFNLSEAVIVGSPETFLLSQNYPNPFNPETVNNYELPSSNNVQLKVYDNSGKELITLVNSFKEAGTYNVTFDGSNFASGVYYYKLTAGNFTSVKKMFIVK